MRASLAASSFLRLRTMGAMNLHESIGDALAIFVGIGAGALVAVLLRV